MTAKPPKLNYHQYFYLYRTWHPLCNNVWWWFVPFLQIWGWRVRVYSGHSKSENFGNWSFGEIVAFPSNFQNLVPKSQTLWNLNFGHFGRNPCNFRTFDPRSQNLQISNFRQLTTRIPMSEVWPKKRNVNVYSGHSKYIPHIPIQFSKFRSKNPNIEFLTSYQARRNVKFWTQKQNTRKYQSFLYSVKIFGNGFWSPIALLPNSWPFWIFGIINNY